MKPMLAALTLAMSLTFGMSAIAAPHVDHGVAGSQVAIPSEGEVKKVDKAQGRLTIKHGPLENLGMPAMTMIFRVKDVAMLDQVKPGDRIKFLAEKINGALTVTRLENVAP